MFQPAADSRWMTRALHLAQRGTIGTHPNPRVGCVLVQGNTCLAEGHHAMCGGPHAEAAALDLLTSPPPAATGDGPDWGAVTAYVSLEPCSHHGRTPPCADRLIAAGVGRVVVGMTDPDPRVSGTGIERLRSAGIRVDVMPSFPEGRWLNRRFLSSFEQQRPWIVLKCAVSRDGMMDAPREPGERGSLPITSPALRKLTHHWRAEEGAILVGAGTVVTDDPALDVREATGPNPLVVVLDPNGRTHPASKVYRSGRQACVVGGPDGLPEQVKRWTVPASGDAFDAALVGLQELGVRSVLVEGGGETLRRMLRRGLWDEFRVCRSPRNAGGGMPAVLPPAGTLLRGVHPFGEDQVEYHVRPESAGWAGCAPPPTLLLPLPS